MMQYMLECLHDARPAMLCCVLTAEHVISLHCIALHNLVCLRIMSLSILRAASRHGF